MIILNSILILFNDYLLIILNMSLFVKMNLQLTKYLINYI